jgi:hypothetical protein
MRNTYIDDMSCGHPELPRHMRRLLGPLLFAYLCVAVAFGCAAPRPSVVTTASSGWADVPSRRCNHFFVVDVMLNGRGPFAMIVDSGASMSVVASHVAHQFPEATLDVRRVRFETGAPSEALASIPVRQFNTVSAGPVTWRQLIALVVDVPIMFDGPPGVRLDGILGYNAFEHLLLQFDYRANMIRVRHGSLRGSPEALRLESAGAPLLSLDIQGHRLHFLIDTGASTTLMVPEDTTWAFSEQPRPVGTRIMLDGTSTQYMGRLAGDLELAGLPFHEPPVTLRKRIAVIGEGILRYYRVTFDASGRRLLLEATHSSPVRLPIPRGAGVSLHRVADSWVVAEVFPGSRAEAMGLLVGDVLVSINGEPVRIAPCASSAEDGTLLIQRGEVVLAVEWRRALLDAD